MNVTFGRRCLFEVLAIVSSVISGSASAVAAQSPPIVPPNVEPEFREAVRAVAFVAQTHVGDTALFRASVQPFGPYDLLVLRPSSAGQVDLIRNFFLGIVGGAAEIYPAPLTNAWHCGPCVSARRGRPVPRLRRVGAVVGRFQRLPSVSVCGPWAHPRIL